MCLVMGGLGECLSIGGLEVCLSTQKLGGLHRPCQWRRQRGRKFRNKCREERAAAVWAEDVSARVDGNVVLLKVS